MITLANIRRAIYNIQKRLSILEKGGGGSSTPVDISGKQDVIDSTHKLASDLVDDSNQTNKFVTSQEKDTWNGKSNFSGDYDDLSNKPTLFSGSYNDLSDKPNLFDGSYNSLSNKPTLFSGNYDDLSNKPAIPSVPSNENAASGGSTLSLVTTGEKYDWNNKANIWRGTQAEYDLINTPDNNTIYIIIPAPL